MLAIVSGDLPVGAKLPSVREIALRHKIHANTVSAAYRNLEELGWLESRKGSGVYARALSEYEMGQARASAQDDLSRLAQDFLSAARSRGYSGGEVLEAIKTLAKKKPPKAIYVVEDEPNLRRILAAEIGDHIGLPLRETTVKDGYSAKLSANSVYIALPETKEKLNGFLPGDAIRFYVKMNSAQEQMKGRERPAPDDLIGVVSTWPMFLLWAETLLVAAGLDAEQIVKRQPVGKNWQSGLSECKFVIADSVAAKLLPKGTEIRIFRMISEESLNEIKSLAG